MTQKNRDSALIQDIREAVSSQSVINTKFLAVTSGIAADKTQVVPNNVFDVNVINTSKVEPRNSAN